ncbi:MAG: hypothetical protein IPF57_14235, partial [Gammaproteobacteria bacterium]|nr:hypothetical protein [Gammaproteobacteria bacterium]
GRFSRADAMFPPTCGILQRRDELVSQLREEMLGLVARAGEGHARDRHPRRAGLER